VVLEQDRDHLSRVIVIVDQQHQGRSITRHAARMVGQRPARERYGSVRPRS
jgi:hypothetical protein